MIRVGAITTCWDVYYVVVLGCDLLTAVQHESMGRVGDGKVVVEHEVG